MFCVRKCKNFVKTDFTKSDIYTMLTIYSRITVLIFIFHSFWPSLLSEVVTNVNVITMDYCYYPCIEPERENVACKCQISKKGNEIVPDVEFRTFVVDIHNHLRNKIASGYLKEIANYSSAKNMNAMSYNLELEYLARCNVVADGDIYEKCAAAHNYNKIGRNIGFSESPTPRLAYFFNKIFDYYNFYDAENIKGFLAGDSPDSTKAISFTQLVWAEDNQVGCGRAWFPSENPSDRYRVICYYAGSKGGNTQNKPVYETGIPCAKCPGRCNKKYKFLCGEIDPIPTDYPVPIRKG